MAFAPKNTGKPLSSIDKRLAKRNAKLQIEREQLIYKNPEDMTLRYSKRTMIQRERAIADQNYRCPICSTWLTEDKRNHYDDHDPRTNRPRGILCKRCGKIVKRMKDPKYYRSDVVFYLNSWK